MEKNSVDFKVLEEIEQGSNVTVVFHDDTKMTGVVMNKFHVSDSYDEDNECYLLWLQINGEHETQINSDDIKCIEKCTTHDAGLITGRSVIEKYDISCDRYMGNVITDVVDKWDNLDDIAKEEISKVLSTSMNQHVMKDMIDAMRSSKQYNTEQHEQIMELIEENKIRVKNINEFYNKYNEMKKCLTHDYIKMLDCILFECCSLGKALKYEIGEVVHGR